jgi:hypothetical protein
MAQKIIIELTGSEVSNLRRSIAAIREVADNEAAREHVQVIERILFGSGVF